MIMVITKACEHRLLRVKEKTVMQKFEATMTGIRHRCLVRNIVESCNGIS